MLKYMRMGKFKNKKKNNRNFQDGYTPKGRPEDLARPIEDLNLSQKTYDALKKGGVNICKDLCVIQASKMYRIQNIGKKNCIEIAAKLKEFNLQFRPEDTNQQPQQNQNPQNNNNQKPQDTKEQKTKLKFSIFDDHELVKFLEGEREREEFKWEEPPQEKLEIFKFCRNGKWGYKNQKGAVVIQPAFDEAFQFSEGYACVEKDSKLGYIDMEGKQVIDYIYDCANSFSEGLACVTKDDKTGYIDYSGNYVFEPNFEKGTPFKDGKAMIKQDGKWGVLSKDGSIYWR